MKVFFHDMDRDYWFDAMTISRAVPGHGINHYYNSAFPCAILAAVVDFGHVCFLLRCPSQAVAKDEKRGRINSRRRGRFPKIMMVSFLMKAKCSKSTCGCLRFAKEPV